MVDTQSLTKESIEQACEELKQALIETVELDKKSQDIKIKQAKAQKRLSLARDIIHSLKLN